MQLDSLSRRQGVMQPGVSRCGARVVLRRQKRHADRDQTRACLLRSRFAPRGLTRASSGAVCAPGSGAMRARGTAAGAPGATPSTHQPGTPRPPGRPRQRAPPFTLGTVCASAGARRAAGGRRSLRVQAVAATERPASVVCSKQFGLRDGASIKVTAARLAGRQTRGAVPCRVLLAQWLVAGGAAEGAPPAPTTLRAMHPPCTPPPTRPASPAPPRPPSSSSPQGEVSMTEEGTQIIRMSTQLNAGRLLLHWGVEGGKDYKVCGVAPQKQATRSTAAPPPAARLQPAGHAPPPPGAPTACSSRRRQWLLAALTPHLAVAGGRPCRAAGACRRAMPAPRAPSSTRTEPCRRPSSARLGSAFAAVGPAQGRLGAAGNAAQMLPPATRARPARRGSMGCSPTRPGGAPPPAPTHARGRHGGMHDCAQGAVGWHAGGGDYPEGR
jgi:hypothetical protein